MRNTTRPIVETIEQFRDKNGELWCVQMHYPQGKANGNDRYWIGTVSNVTRNESIACHTLLQLDYETRKLRQPCLFR